MVAIDRKVSMKQSKNSIVTNPMDYLIFELVNKDCEIISDLISKHQKDFETIPKLSEDVFESLYKALPELEDLNDMDIDHEVNHMMMNHGLGLPDYKMLRGYTKLDEFSSVICSEVITEELMLFHKEVIKPIEEAIEKLKEKLKKDKKSPEAIAAAAEKAFRKMYNKACKDGLEEVMSRATRSAINQSSEMSSLDSAWGRESGSEQRLPFKEKMAIAKKLKADPKLRQITKMAGKMRNVALSSRKSRISPGTSEVFEVKEGSDVPNILPSELAMYYVKEFRPLFLKRLAAGELLEYELIDRERDQKGPIVICIDNSGSMCGDAEVWSKAIAIGMYELACKDNRKMIVNHFSSASDPIKKFVFEPNTNNTEKLIEMASFFLGGGTDFEKPLSDARNDIDENLPDADIIFITDGICNVGDAFLEDFLEWKKEKKVRIYSFLVDIIGNDMDILYKFSDMAMPASHLTNDNNTELDLYKMI